MKKMMTIMCVMLIMLTTLAAAQEAETTTFPEEKVLPDQRFMYGIKRFGERVEGFFKFTDETKAVYNMRLARVRVAEIEQLPPIERQRYMEQLLADYDEKVEEAKANADDIDNPEVKTRVMERLEVNLQRHIEVLTRVSQNVPQQAGERIRQVIDEQVQRKAQVRSVIENIPNENVPVNEGSRIIGDNQVSTGG